MRSRGQGGQVREVGVKGGQARGVGVRGVGVRGVGVRGERGQSECVRACVVCAGCVRMHMHHVWLD